MAGIDEAYASVSDYCAVHSKTSSDDDDQILRDLLAISRYLERKLGRFFTKDEADVIRQFTPPHGHGGYRADWAESENPWLHGPFSRTLTIDDLAAAPTTVKSDEDWDGVCETEWATTDYQLLPLNAGLGPEPKPYTELSIPEWSTRFGFTRGRLIEITGVWGWPAVPETVRRACIELTAILRLESPRATQRVNEMDQVIGTSKQARDIVEQLTRDYKQTGSLF